MLGTVKLYIHTAPEGDGGRNIFHARYSVSAEIDPEPIDDVEFEFRSVHQEPLPVGREAISATEIIRFAIVERFDGMKNNIQSHRAWSGDADNRAKMDFIRVAVISVVESR